MTQLEQLKQQYQALKDELAIIWLVKNEDYAEIMAGRQPQSEEFKALIAREYSSFLQVEALKKQIKKLEPRKPVTRSAFKRYNPREYYD